MSECTRKVTWIINSIIFFPSYSFVFIISMDHPYLCDGQVIECNLMNLIQVLRGIIAMDLNLIFIL